MNIFYIIKNPYEIGLKKKYKKYKWLERAKKNNNKRKKRNIHPSNSVICVVRLVVYKSKNTRAL